MTPLAFLLVAQPRWFFGITAASAAHLVVYYTVLCGGFPWYIGIAKQATNPIWMASSNIAWAAYIICFAMPVFAFFQRKNS